MRRHYVYYRVPQGRLAEAMQAALAMQRSLRERHAGLLTELLRGPEPEAEAVTLMEVYELADVNLAAQIEAEMAAAMAPWIAGARHVEAFDRVG